MSSVIVPIVTIDEVLPHPNADRLAVIKVGGWQVVVGKDSVKAGDTVLYIQPDAVVKRTWSDHWQVTNYLSNGRVKSVKLRGEPSFGFTAMIGIKETEALYTAGLIDDTGAIIDLENVAHAFGITKYAPPIKGFVGNQRQEDPRLSRFTSIENLRHFPGGFTEGQDVWISEKTHGSQSRVSLIDGEWMAASKRVQRDPERDESGAIVFEASKSSTYWYPLTLDPVRDLLSYFATQHKQVILFGEIYGPSIQKFDYGIPKGQLGYVAFDLMLDGTYVDGPEFSDICQFFRVPQVPVLYSGPYDAEKAKALTLGRSLLGGEHIREGIVIKPFEEDRDPKFGRRVLKLIADDFLTGGVEDLQEEAA